MYELAAAKPNWGQVGKGFIPRAELVTNQTALFNAIGILGATVMPHNLYLHSSIIQVRLIGELSALSHRAVVFLTARLCQRRMCRQPHHSLAASAKLLNLNTEAALSLSSEPSSELCPCRHGHIHAAQPARRWPSASAPGTPLSA